MKKKLPKFKTIEKEAEFWGQHDSADYIDWNKAKKAHFPAPKPFSNLEKNLSPASRKRVNNKAKRLLQEMALGELRHAKELSQEELSKRLRVEQPQVSRLEKRADMYISTLRKYIEAVGGQMEIIAKFPEGNVLINQFGEI